jgi:subtilase family serine protease
MHQARHTVRTTITAVAVLLALLAAAAVASAAPGRVVDAACARPAGPNAIRCTALVKDLVRRQSVVSVSGYGPAQLRAAYGVSSLATINPASTQTVAIVDAFSDPHLAGDIAAYRKQFGIASCTTASGCLRIVGQTGSGALPAGNAAWGLETSLDAEMVSAICPRCHILVVEANGATYGDLGTAENEAVALGATVVTNSWGGTDTRMDSTYDAKYFTHPGVAIVASTGDAGYAAGAIYPSTSPNVIAVGGTTLTPDATTARGFSESAWSGAGSGCSAYEPMPVWQAAVVNAVTACGTNRAVADVAAVANPSTGVAVYDTYGYAGWLPGQIGGTSVAAPIVAGLYALTGHGAGAGRLGAAGLYAHASYTTPTLFDVTGGANGTCSTVIACTAGTGWDGPTGLGSPAGIAGL